MLMYYSLSQPGNSYNPVPRLEPELETVILTVSLALLLAVCCYIVWRFGP